MVTLHVEPRNGKPIVKLVLHTNEGPEGANHAQGLAGYLLGNGDQGGGYNAVFDDTSTVIVQPDDVECWANGAVNGNSLDGCIIGYAAFTPADWQANAASIEQAAQWFASKCRLYGIPPVHLTGARLHDELSRGICTHGDLTRAGFQGTLGHTDPGDNFPIDSLFVARVAALCAPVSPPIPTASQRAVAALVAFLGALVARPIKLGDSGPAVLKAQALLKRHSPAGTDLGISGQYGPKMAAVVARFKKAHGLKNLDGDAIGRACYIELLKP